MKVYHRDEWSEDDGDVLWWRFPIDGPPYVGTPLDLGYTVEVSVRSSGVIRDGKTWAVPDVGAQFHNVLVGGWPGHHTHWTRIEYPEEQNK